MINIEQSQIVNSALWAAYGDALGFITELADKKILKIRTGLEQINQLVPWKRKVGGKFGAIVELPSGAYSDDTQLRLATSRAIKSNGHFAIHSFSKIEIPVWQNYALGAGRGCKAAANALTKNNVTWMNNFFDVKGFNYINGGGNGAAMRIQPHVWSASDLNDNDKYILDVVKNAVTTHGHPRAIAGAVFHALSLAYTLLNHRLPGIAEFRIFNDWILEIPRIVTMDINLETIWQTQYESSAAITLDHAFSVVHKEVESLISQVSDWLQSTDKSYQSLASTLDLFDEKTRGSGTLTAVAASAAALLIDDMPVDTLLQGVVNTLGTDTDSIATMMGAMIGVVIDQKPPGSLQDEEYIIEEAQRLHTISQGGIASSFDYPDAMTYKAPSSLVDYITNRDNYLYMYPFGATSELQPPFKINSGTNNATFYQWVKSSFGQSFLIKRRDYDAIKLTAVSAATPYNTPPNGSTPAAQPEQVNVNTRPLNNVISIDELTSIAIKNNFDQQLIGSHIIALSESNLGINGTIAYSAIISKAIQARKVRAH